MTRDLNPLSLLQSLQILQVTSFNDPVSYAIHPAILTLTSLRELSLRALGLELIQVRLYGVQSASTRAGHRSLPVCVTSCLRRLHRVSCSVFPGSPSSLGPATLSRQLPDSRLRPSRLPLKQAGRLVTGHVMSLQDGISKLQNLEVLEVVGASSLRLEPGIGRLPNLMSMEFNSCE